MNGITDKFKIAEENNRLLSAYRPTIARTIKTLQSREFICRIGSDKTGHWEIIRKEGEE